MNKRLFVFDTSTLIGAILFETSIPRQAYDLARQNGNILLSQATLDELNEVLRRKKFNKYVSEVERLAFLDMLKLKAAFIEVTATITACRDPKDNKFLELSVSGNAESIIASDQDLLELHPFEGIAILKPRDFLEQENPTGA